MAQEQTLSGADTHETDQRLAASHLLGDWGGERSRLLARGVDFDLHYLTDAQGNADSLQKSRFEMWNRIRGTVDIDLGKLIERPGWYFHATALWQAGDNIGGYLGLITNPSGIASHSTFRLGSWWLEKRWLQQRVAVRAGQFAGEDTYGNQNFGSSFVFEPMNYAFGNLATTAESYDPPATPAFEIRLVPKPHFYVKAMVLASDRNAFAHNPTGLVPQFRNGPVSVSEIGFSPGKSVAGIRPADDAQARVGYSGLYQFGAAYNPGKFVAPASGELRSGNYLLYWMGSQALWREDRRMARGLDATLAYDWSPANVNQQNTVLTAGLRFNEPLHLHIHNTMSLGFVQNTLSPAFLTQSMPSWKKEDGAEFNTLFVAGPFLVQPVIQYFANVGGGVQRAVVCGLRVKVEL